MRMSKRGQSRNLVYCQNTNGLQSCTGECTLWKWKPETVAWVKLGLIMTGHGHLELTMFESVIEISSKSLL